MGIREAVGGKGEGGCIMAIYHFTLSGIMAIPLEISTLMYI